MKPHEIIDPCAVLGIHRSATAEEIKSAYRRLARELHPDVNSDATRDEFLRVKAAYERLTCKPPVPKPIFPDFDSQGFQEALARAMIELLAQYSPKPPRQPTPEEIALEQKRQAEQAAYDEQHRRERKIAHLPRLKRRRKEKTDRRAKKRRRGQI